MKRPALRPAFKRPRQNTKLEHIPPVAGVDLGPSTGRMVIIRDGFLWVRAFVSGSVVDQCMRTARKLGERAEAWEEFERGALLLGREG